MMRPRSAPSLRVVDAAYPPMDEVTGDLDAVYRRFAPYVAAIATRLLGRNEEVDDLVQDVFVQALRGLEKLREPDAVRGWLAKVTVRLSVRRLRRRRFLATLLPAGGAADYERLAADGASPEQRALLARVYIALDGLPAKTRVIWLLRHVMGESLQAIVELTACSQSTVQRKLRDAEQQLDQELRDDR